MTDKTQPTAHAEITAPISADLRGIEQEARECPEPSPSAGMNLGQRILHVGGRENAAGYIEFGSVAAVRALVGQVLRDMQAAPPAPAGVAVPAVAMTSSEIGEIASAWIHPGQSVGLAVVRDVVEAVLHRLRGKIEIRESAIRATLAAAPAQAVAVQDELILSVDKWFAQNTGLGGCSDKDVAELAAIFAAAPAQEHATQLAGQGQEPSPPVAVSGPVEWPATCDGLEQEAWEAWARVQRFDMSEHPMHYLFLNERTDAARQGWKGGLVYAVEQMKQRVHVVEAAPAQAQEDARDATVLMGYMHPGAFHPYQYKRWQEGNTVAVRLNGWKNEHLQVPVYAKQSAVDAARAAQGGA